MAAQHAKGRSDRWVERAMWVLMSSPFLLLLSFLTLVVHARIGSGHWPTFESEPYDAAAFQIHRRVFVAIGCFTIWAAIPLWLALVCIQRFRPSWSPKPPVLQAMLYVIGWGAIAVYAILDQGRLVGWLFD